MKHQIFLLIVSFSFLIVAGCQPISKVAPTSIQPSNPTLVVPTADNITAVIHGIIISEESNKPPEAIFYLAMNSTAKTKDAPAVLAFSNQNSPRAEVADSGEFVFRNVNPGQYAMMLWFPSKEPYFVPAADGQDYWWINVKAGEVLEMGEIKIP